MALEQSQEPSAALDRAAFLRLFDEYLPRIYAYVGGRIGDRDAAEAITGATFRRAIEVAANEGLDRDAFANVLFRVAASAVVDHGRRARATYPGGVRAADFDRVTDPARSALVATEEAAARAFVAAIDRRALRGAIQGLPDGQRRLIVLRHLDALSVDEQCTVLGLRRETLARRVNTALRSVHAALAEEAAGAA
jgi:RNA polymerase sigma-70 factor (ECF subfamily)